MRRWITILAAAFIAGFGPLAAIAVAQDAAPAPNLQDLERRIEEAKRQQAQQEAARAEAARKAAARAEAERRAQEEAAQREARRRAREVIERNLPEMATIPAGSFRMGSPAGEIGREEDEGPVHVVQVAGFRLAKTELTVAAFREFVDVTGYRTEAETNAGNATGCFAYDRDDTEKQRNWRPWASWRKPNQYLANQDGHPVSCVSWNDAKAYIGWLNANTDGHWRLPTEAEWEYAARAGSGAARYWGDDPGRACANANVADRTPDEAGYSYGDAGHQCKDGYPYVSPVGKFQGNAFGLYDMLGNVWEWTEDCWHEGYGGAPGDGSAWTTGGDCGRRVDRGGGWSANPAGVRSANRYGDAPSYRSSGLGFRLAEDLP